jgi:hypothetical protein
LQAKASAATQEIIDQARWQGLRLVVAHHPERAKEQTVLRRERIAALQEKANQWAGKLNGQDVGVKARGRKLSDSGAKARLYHEVCDAHLARIVKVDLKSELFSYTLDEPALAQAELMDGKLLLVTNVADLTARRVGAALQGTGRHRARVPHPQVRNRDRSGVPPAARADPRTRHAVLHGVDRLPGDEAD